MKKCLKLNEDVLVQIFLIGTPHEVANARRLLDEILGRIVDTVMYNPGFQGPVAPMPTVLLGPKPPSRGIKIIDPKTGNEILPPNRGNTS